MQITEFTLYAENVSYLLDKQKSTFLTYACDASIKMKYDFEASKPEWAVVIVALDCHRSSMG